MNPRLRMVLLKCRASNMPNDNIDRAIKRGTGGGEMIEYTDLHYEVFGPHGVAILVELSTDNKNRTAAEIRSLLAKNGGTIATTGSVSRLFQRKGQIIVLREAAGEDQLMELALDPARLEAVHKAVEAGGIKAAGAEVTWLPVSTVPVNDAKAAEEVNRLVELLEEHDDVKDVYSNAEFPA
jgi:transcriptional/translational regulatory protein YebC/TACO1